MELHRGGGRSRTSGSPGLQEFDDTTKRKLKKGIYISRCFIPANFLNATTYFIGLAVSSYYPAVNVHFYEESCLSFNVQDPLEGVSTRPETGIPIPGAIRPYLEWEIEKI